MPTIREHALAVIRKRGFLCVHSYHVREVNSECPQCWPRAVCTDQNCGCILLAEKAEALLKVPEALLDVGDMVAAINFQGYIYCPSGGCSPCEGPDYIHGGDGAEPLPPGPIEVLCSYCEKPLMISIEGFLGRQAPASSSGG